MAFVALAGKGETSCLSREKKDGVHGNGAAPRLETDGLPRGGVGRGEMEEHQGKAQEHL